MHECKFQFSYILIYAETINSEFGAMPVFVWKVKNIFLPQEL
jgi:hypothetical protein